MKLGVLSCTSVEFGLLTCVGVALLMLLLWLIPSEESVVELSSSSSMIIIVAGWGAETRLLAASGKPNTP